MNVESHWQDHGIIYSRAGYAEDAVECCQPGAMYARRPPPPALQSVIEHGALFKRNAGGINKMVLLLGPDLSQINAILGHKFVTHKYLRADD